MARPAARSAANRSEDLVAVILAAGEGTRMKSRRAKVLHEVAGRPLIVHVVASARGAGARRVVVVVGVQGDEVAATVRAAFPGLDVAFVEQRERRGTADAVARARPALRGHEGDVLVLCGDVPALDAASLARLVRRHRRQAAALTVLTAELDDPSGYGRIVRDAKGAVRAIVEHRDASADERAIREINTGTYCAHWPRLDRALRRIRPDNAQGEYYLTDAVRVLIGAGERVAAERHPEPELCLGVNSREQLARVGAAMNRRTLRRLMASGVTILDPASTWIDDGVRVGRDTVIHPGVRLEGQTAIGRDCVIRSGVRLTDVEVGPRALVRDYTVAEQSSIGAGATVGPFAHLRPGSEIGRECKIGNFVETKKARFAAGAKASHLSYIGDAEVGRGVNIGAGTITCNYDGEAKHRTVLEDGVFIGSDTQLVAPVTVGRGAYVGAGATITRDVPAGALALSRIPQKIIEGWVARRRRRKARKAGGGAGG